MHYLLLSFLPRTSNTRQSGTDMRYPFGIMCCALDSDDPCDCQKFNRCDEHDSFPAVTFMRLLINYILIDL